MADRAAGGTAPESALPALTSQEAAALARQHDLSQVGIRPPLRDYLRDLWRSRQFLWTLSSSQSYARNQNNHLGQLWMVFNPILLVASYFFVFGLVLDTSRGVGNFLGFLTVGIFLFASTATTLTKGCRAIIGNTGLIRALQFPRAILPLSITLTELIASLPSLVVLVILMLVTGEAPGLSWLFFPVAILSHFAINTGLVLIASRIVNGSRDLANMVNVVVRLLRYVAGVFFSIDHYVHGVLAVVLGYSPFAVGLSMARQALMDEFAIDPLTWLIGVGWAVLLPVFGLIFFWRGEASYGRG